MAPEREEGSKERPYPFADVGAIADEDADLLVAAAAVDPPVVPGGFLRRVMLPVGLMGLSGKRISRC